MRYDKKIKSKKKIRKRNFFDETYFSKDFENRKFQKVTFFEKVDFFEKVRKNVFFSKILTFLKMLSFSTKIEKITFWNFRFCKIFRKMFFIEKNKSFRIFFYFLFLYRISCITSSSGIAELPLCRPWARLTSPPKIRKSRKFTFLKIFGSTFSL